MYFSWIEVMLVNALRLRACLNSSKVTVMSVDGDGDGNGPGAEEGLGGVIDDVAVVELVVCALVLIVCLAVLVACAVVLIVDAVVLVVIAEVRLAVCAVVPGVCAMVMLENTSSGMLNLALATFPIEIKMFGNSGGCLIVCVSRT